MKNITKKTQTILFASLIAAMILPFSGMNTADAKEIEGYEVMDIASASTAIEPYATINEDGSVTIDKSNAKQNLSKQDFKIAKDYLKYQNHLVKQLRDTPDKKPVHDEYSEMKFSKLANHIKDKKAGNQSSVIETIGNMFVPNAYAAWGDVCGQSPWNPLPQPTVYLKTGLPDEERPFTIREYARIQSFPDSWKFVGSISSQYKQIGNAVPVKLGKVIGKSLLNALGSKKCLLKQTV